MIPIIYSMIRSPIIWNHFLSWLWVDEDGEITFGCWWLLYSFFSFSSLSFCLPSSFFPLFVFGFSFFLFSTKLLFLDKTSVFFQARFNSFFFFQSFFYFFFSFHSFFYFFHFCFPFLILSFFKFLFNRLFSSSFSSFLNSFFSPPFFSILSQLFLFSSLLFNSFFFSWNQGFRISWTLMILSFLLSVFFLSLSLSPFLSFYFLT